MLSLTDGTSEEIKYRNLVLHFGNMRFIEEGGKLVIFKEEWHNKSLGRGSLDLIKVNPNGSEEILISNYFFYTGYDIKELIETVYPWANLSVDIEFYENYYEDNFDEFNEVFNPGYIYED